MSVIYSDEHQHQQQYSGYNNNNDNNNNNNNNDENDNKENTLTPPKKPETRERKVSRGLSAEVETIRTGGTNYDGYMKPVFVKIAMKWKELALNKAKEELEEGGSDGEDGGGFIEEDDD